jgi:transcriptional regulator with XRE-family HTH domain
LPRTRKHYISPVDEKTIGRRLRELRLQRGFTQQEVAHKLGITQAAVSDYEKGEVRLHAALIAGFSKILRSSADEILGLGKSPPNGIVSDRRVMRLMHEISGLPRRERDALLKTMTNFVRGSRTV